MANFFNNEKKFQLTIWEILLIVFLSLFFLGIPMLVFNNSIDLKYLEKPSNIGNNIGGILAPFLSLVGSVLVYIAFKVQFKANQDIQEQFKKQNEDQHFFRLIDSLDKRLTLYSFKATDNEQYSGYSILGYFLKRIRKNIDKDMEGFSEKLFLNNSDVFNDEDFEKMFKHILYKDIFPTCEKFKEEYFKADYDERYRIFNYDSDDNFNVVIKKIIISKFYSLPIKHIRGFYQYILSELVRENTSFFDGYFKTLDLIMDHIEESDNPEFYINFLKGNLTTSEKIIILLYVGSYKSSTYLEKKIFKFGIINSLITVGGVKIGNVTEEEYHKHIKALMTRNQG